MNDMKRLILITIAISIALASVSAIKASEITITGKLQKTIEAGGWLIVGKSKYLLINSNKFQSESWFKESTNVEATGETRDVMTIYMEGTPFEARTMSPIDQAVTKPEEDSRRVTRVLVAGDSLVQAQPDTAILLISVVTQSRQAIEAQQQNATRSEGVLRAVKAAAGTGSEVKTSGYSLQPQRVYKEGQLPTITGYEARNTVSVTLSDLTKVGAVIDAASQSGANDVAGISFTLRQDRPARDKALSEATREAMSKAQVIASALGGRVARIVEVQEDGFQRPQPIYQGGEFAMARAQASTPIEVGSLEIRSRVQLVAEVEMNP
jgi:uncharacterized protein YggE